MISGMLIRDAHLDKLDLKKNYLKKCLGADLERREAIIRARANAWFDDRYWPANDYLQDYGAHDCLLVDEKKPLCQGSNTTIVKIKHTKENEPESLFNVHVKRKIKRDLF